MQNGMHDGICFGVVAMLQGGYGVRGGVRERDAQIRELILQRELRTVVYHMVGTASTKHNIHRLLSVHCEVVGAAEDVQGIK
jgi:hypothetical protein